MEYADYMGLPDDLFFIEVFKLYDGVDKCRLQFLKDRPFIMERFKKLFSDNYVRGNKKCSARSFIRLYDSYVILSNVYSVINKPLKYYGENRIRIFNSYYSFSGDFKGLRFFSKEEKEKISYVVGGFNLSRKINEKSNFIEQYESKYQKIVLSFRKILGVYSKQGDSGKFYSMLYDDMKIKQSTFNSLVKYTKLFFCQDLCSGSNIINKGLINDFSLDDIYLLEKISSDYSKIFCKYNFKVVNVYTISDYERLFKLFDQINTSLIRRRTLEYTVGFLSNDLQISLENLENYYYSVLKSFCNYKLIGFDCDVSLKNVLDNRRFKFLDISNFTDIMSMYRNLAFRSCHLIDLICGDTKNINGLINMIYEIKFFNRVTPSMNHCSLVSRLRFLNYDERKKCEKFVLGYKAYYNSKKDFLNGERRQEITDNEVNNMDSYVTNVKLFLDSGCKCIDDYFGENIDDKENFKFSLKILKKYDHPIYRRYSDYLSFISDEDYNRMIGDCLEIVNLINNGIISIDGSKRNFDLVDYYLHTSLSKQKFMDAIRDRVSHDEYANVSCFFSRYKGDKKIEGADIDKLYTTKISFPCEWDSDGSVISYYDATKEDIMDAIVTIGKMGIPLTSMTYGIILRNKILKNISEKNLTNHEKRV